jgi:glutathione synthase/RimK-type ligase-like ATP-grasp enzyme
MLKTLFLQHSTMKIAFISCRDYGKYSVGYHDEESHLLDFLLKKGLDIERQVWNDAAVDWKQYDLGIIKSPWDYHEQPELFHNWLNAMQQINLRLLNPAETLKWNSDKHYLNDIAAVGMNVVPTLFLEKGTQPDLLSVFDHLQADKIVIKPCISAGAKMIIALTREQAEAHEAPVYQLLSEESFMAQPFMEEIYDGECSYIFFNGQFSHCILNAPGNGDFRVQHYHGGSTKAVEVNPDHVEDAAAYVRKFGADTLYARVDTIVSKGQLCLTELELIEPFLYLDTNLNSYERYYSALSDLTK